MKNSITSRRLTAGFTLIELLVVISIIAILAGMIIPTVSKARGRALVAKARTEISGLVTAINQYENDYSRMPASMNARASVGDLNPDFTFGTVHQPAEGNPRAVKVFDKGDWIDMVPPNYPSIVNRTSPGSRPHNNSNAEVMAALMAREAWANGELTFNAANAMNPKKNPYIEVKEVDDARRGGLGPDGIYRDPWGRPYIVTLDLNYDGRSRDAFYRLASVSWTGTGNTGLNGLSRAPNTTDDFEASRSVMAWSFGPDGGVNPDQKAGVGENADNVLSW
jgi:prepilin-type N-terminal cleavage/methylation domain-containing protein